MNKKASEEQINRAYNLGFSVYATANGLDEKNVNKLYDQAQTIANTRNAIVETLLEQKDQFKKR